MESQMHNILKRLAPYSILVGSAARASTYNDIDLVIGAKGLAIAKEILPNWQSVFIGHVKSFDTEIPVEVMRHWYGPSYEQLKRKKDLITVSLFGIEFKAWPHHRDTREGKR